MWVLADYEASALFTLKPATATSSGGKTLLTPTPFAIKMALLDVICRAEGVDTARRVWEILRRARIALRPAQRVVVTNTFTKILKPRRHPAQPGSAHAGPLQKTIGYREYAFIDGRLGIALEIDDTIAFERISLWRVGMQYLGRRGAFMQVVDPPLSAESLPENYTIVRKRFEE
jgi:hypothetical protein